MDCETIREGRLEALYGEADERMLALVREHEAACSACSEETAAFSALRRDLARWTLFEPRVRPQPPRPLIPRWLAIAATVILAICGGLGLARPDFSWRDGGLRLAFGGRTNAPDGLLAETARQREDIAALRAVLSRLEQRTGRAAASTATLAPADVAALVRASEDRQLRAMESRLTAFGHRLDAQRRLDFARMSAGLVYLDQRSGRDAARTNELMGHVLQASQRR